MTDTNNEKSELVQLIDEYANTQHKLAEKDKADLEAQIWELKKAEQKKSTSKIGRKEFFRSEFGIKHHHSQARLMISRLEENLRERLWSLIDGGEISLSAAEEIIREARRDHRVDGADLVESANSRLDIHLESRGPVEKTERKGVRARRSKFRADLEVLTRDFVTWRLEDSAPEVRQEIILEFMELVTNAEKRLAYLITQELNAQKQNREIQEAKDGIELAAACKVLGVEPPKDGESIDMVKIKAKKKELARAHHPDLSGGNDSKYKEVIDAYKAIERHVGSA